MNGLSHKQARRYIYADLDGLLSDAQRFNLETHLARCEVCRAEVDSLSTLTSHLQNEFHERWDVQDGPFQNVMTNIQSQTWRILMSNRIKVGFKILASIVGLIAFTLALNYIFPHIQSPASSSETALPAISNHPLVIDTAYCKPFSDTSFDVRPPIGLYSYEPIQGTSLVDGDFTYEFWLYCDPSLTPDDPTHWSAIAGLGVSASWRYDGPKVEGTTQDYYGFGSDIKLSTGWNGPLDKASVGLFRTGVDLSEQVIQQHIQQGTPIQFRMLVDSPLGRNGAIFSFNLEPTQSGYKIQYLHAEPLAPAYSGLIAFTSAIENGSLDIYTMLPDGKGLTNLTNNPAHDSNPIWSPDGRYIAFESNRSGPTQIYSMDADGSNVVQLTIDSIDHQLPLNIDGDSNPWSPDGSRILFLHRNSSEYNPPNAIWTLRSRTINGENLVTIATGRISFSGISWSPSGKYIGYILNESSDTESFVPDIYIVDADGNNPRRLKDLIHPNEHLQTKYYWSSDGRHVIFTTIENDPMRERVYEFDPETNTLLQKDILRPELLDWRDDTAFSMDVNQENLSFIWQNSDGTSNTLDWGTNCWEFNFKRSPGNNFAIGAYCPDDKFELYWANSDGSMIKKLLDSFAVDGINGVGDIVWSPDDQYIAFVIPSLQITYMYILNIEESLKDPSIQPIKVVIGGGDLYFGPSWQPKP